MTIRPAFAIVLACVLSTGGCESNVLQVGDDLASVPASDLAVRADLAVAPDLSVPVDLAVAPDLSAPVDLAVAPDLSVPLDLTPPPDLTTPRCDDKVQNGKETDVDCGGGCPGCGLGMRCAVPTDCASSRCAANLCANGVSCLDVKSNHAQAADGVYTIDPDGLGGGAPFQVWCDMTIDGGGWTLITSHNAMGGATDVQNNNAPITPASSNLTNRNMRLPGVKEILVVQDGKDQGFDMAFDKAEKYSNVMNHPLSWQQILDALNKNSGMSWNDDPYVQGVDDPWQFTVVRVNQAGCLQTPLRGTYGDGNHGSFNYSGGGAASGANSTGTLWHHWGMETWIAGVFANGGYMTCNASARTFMSWWKGTYLR